MVNYKNGKIYKITCETGLIYIGSTTRLLKERLRQHKYDMCRCKDFINPKIELIENVECETKTELLTRERYYIESIECVNLRIPLRTYEESLKHRREQYSKCDKEARAKKKKEYYELNKDKIKAKNKLWHEKNKEKTKQYLKEWREKQKKSITEK